MCLVNTTQDDFPSFDRVLCTSVFTFYSYFSPIYTPILLLYFTLYTLGLGELNSETRSFAHHQGEPLPSYDFLKVVKFQRPSAVRRLRARPSVSRRTVVIIGIFWILGVVMGLFGSRNLSIFGIFEISRDRPSVARFYLLFFRFL